MLLQVYRLELLPPATKSSREFFRNGEYETNLRERGWPRSYRGSETADSVLSLASAHLFPFPWTGFSKTRQIYRRAPFACFRQKLQSRPHTLAYSLEWTRSHCLLTPLGTKLILFIRTQLEILAVLPWKIRHTSGNNMHNSIKLDLCFPEWDFQQRNVEFFRITRSSAEKNTRTCISVYFSRKRATLLNFSRANSPRCDISGK